ncbi:MAG: electron transport complex subunit RsxC [Phocaeicola sp.]
MRKEVKRIKILKHKKVKTFRMGGVHPPEHKLSANKAIETLALPKQAVFPLSQHIGAPATAIVKKGDLVKVGTKIAEAGGFVSASIFSSVSGKVNKVDSIVDASGYRKPAIFIDVEGDEWEESIDRSTTFVKECALTAPEIVARIKACGIVGLGGACFPTHVKLSPPPGAKAECLIINAVECEPYLTADHQLMLEKADEILVGVSILMKGAHVTKGYIGIENNKPDAIQLMSEKAAQYGNIEIVPLKVQYPQGGEKQLIDAVIRRQVPAPPSIPIHVGAVVQNVGTAYAVYEAVQKNKPLFERVVTVTGKSVVKPSNFLTRIGTPMTQLIEAAGGLPEDTGKVVGGGPMMGKALVSTDIPICKGSSGVLLMNEKEAKRAEEENCIRCAKCVSVCPMGLEPFLLATLSEYKEWEKVENEEVISCIECGSCQYTCPSKRYLLDYIRLGKATVGGIIRSRSANR